MPREIYHQPLKPDTADPEQLAQAFERAAADLRSKGETILTVGLLHVDVRSNANQDNDDPSIEVFGSLRYSV